MKPWTWVLAVAFFGGFADAQSLPDVFENAWLEFDVASFQNGEWVKRKLEREGEAAVEYRVACVGVEGDIAWIEETRTTAEFFPGTSILCSVSRKDRKVQRAFWGKPGEAVRELKIAKGGHPDPGNEAASGTAEVAPQVVRVKDKEHKGERVELKMATESMEGKRTTRQLVVVAEGIPFPLHADEKGVVRATIQEGDCKWSGKPAWKGGLVTLELDGREKWKLTLVDWGTDAKQTMRKP